MSIVSIQGTEPIPGYALLERIGVGAYGEVWRAEAPGGLVKAVKIVYGYHNESRALRELQSLQRVKQLRHPFLLSLERIEVVDGRLIIVTELADMSLKDRFLACCAAGDPGISRHELLGHVRDAADALDFINESQSLQHLDIKGENLLLVGGRLKLGDFGLVQNLSERDAGLLDGMTPRYAAPELFKGQPTKYSDQYSLAVVYAELLTGQMLFEARSPAEFAVQHLIGTKPRLDELPAPDRAVVARALSRNPDDRYPNCRAFVDSLVAGLSSTASSASRPMPAKKSAGGFPEQADEPVAGPSSAQPGSVPAGDDLTVMLTAVNETRQPGRRSIASASVHRLPPLEAEQLAWEARPTLFIGVGGAANQVLSRLRKRLEERFLFADRIPAWRSLLIDTDAGALESVVGVESVDSGPAADTLLLKMRTTQDYREGSPQLLKWLSRRWLYNIARVPRTSGWRPLGRLALVDCAAQVMDRLRKVIQEFATAEAIASSAEITNAAFATKPVIVLVASISGGTGSGIVLDLAYAVRKLAAELNLGAYDLRGILLHATDQDPDSQDLAKANSFACLTELAHFNRPGCGYPGEESLQVPAFPSVVPTFDETFVMHLGDDLVQAEFVDQIERVSDFLYYGVATCAGALLDSARAGDLANETDAQADLVVRTFGLYAVNNLRREEVDGFVDRVCQAIAAKWIGSGSVAIGNSATIRFRGAAGNEGAAAQLKDLVEQSLGPCADQEFIHELIRSLESYLPNTAGANAQSQDQANPAHLRRTLSAVSAELSDLASSLLAIRGGIASPVAPDTGDNRPPGKAPLDNIRLTVKSFLDARAMELAESLARDFPRMFLRRERRASEADDRAGQALTGFCRHLRMTVRASIVQALKQVDVSRLLLEMAGKSRAAREPMRDLITAATPRLTVPEAAERLFVFAPGYSDHGTLRWFFNDELQENATIVQTEDDRLTLYCEQTQLHLCDVAASVIDENFRYVEVASRLHTRIDVHWAPLRPAQKEESLV